MQSGYPWNQSARGEWRGGCTYSRNKFTLRLSYTVPCMIIISPFFHYFFHFQRRPSSNIRFNTPRSFSGDSASRWQGVSQTQLVTRVAAGSRPWRMMRRDFNYHAGQHSPPAAGLRIAPWSLRTSARCIVLRKKFLAEFVTLGLWSLACKLCMRVFNIVDAGYDITNKCEDNNYNHSFVRMMHFMPSWVCEVL